MKTASQLIKEAGLRPQDLGPDIVEVIELEKQALADAKEFPDEKDIIEGAKQTSSDAIAMVKKSLKAIKTSQQSESEKKRALEAKKQKSASVMKVVRDEDEPELEACRARINAFNKARREANPKPPKPQKTRITKLKEKLLSLIKLMPDAHAQDSKIIDCTEDILQKTLLDLKKCWGMNRIEGAQKAITESIDNYREKSEKQSA